MKYRWLDLRREHMQRNIRIRAQLVRIIREEMEREGFVDIETPMLWKPTPEGARDFVVPSRLQPGKFYALPQSPQIAKQLLVISGFERYYQIARCLRDEDPRADRLQELTQLDVEMAFPDREFLFALMERIVVRIWRECIGVELAAPFERMTLRRGDAALRHRPARPALRHGDPGGDRRRRAARSSACSRTRRACATSPCRRSSRAPRCRRSRTRRSRGARRASRTSSSARTARSSSPIAKFLDAELLERWREPGHTLLFVADEPRLVAKVLGLLRLQLGRELDLVDESLWKFLWIVDMPSAEWDEQNGALDRRAPSVHAPDRRQHRDLQDRPGRGARGGVRPRRQRDRARRRLVPDPRAVAPAAGLREPRHRRGGAAREVRLPARRARDGRAAARRHRVGHRPADDGAARTSRTSATRRRSRRTRSATTT